MKPTSEDRKLAARMQSLAKEQLDGQINTLNKEMEKEIDLLGVVLKTFTVVALIIIAVYSFYAFK